MKIDRRTDVFALGACFFEALTGKSAFERESEAQTVAAILFEDRPLSPRAVVPESVMPPYAFLADVELEGGRIKADLAANQMLGVPYTDEMLEKAAADLFAQATPDGDDASAFSKRWPTALVRDFDGDPSRVTEMDAIIAYMQMLGTTVDFSTYEPGTADNLR